MTIAAQIKAGQAGLDLIKKVKPDLVITDLITPGIDGYELARSARADPATTSTPNILQTAHYLESEVRRIAALVGIQTGDHQAVRAFGAIGSSAPSQKGRYGD